ncbi:Eco57I restriction-modification methylase domain-containing protein [Treponema denticola]
MIGNPPYVQLQDDGGKLAEMYKPAKFNTFNRMGDIYQLFYEKGIALLRKDGHLCYITSNKWMRAGYGETSRKYFAEQTQPKILIDLAGEKVFENATVDVNILLLQKAAYTQNTYALRGGLECLKDRSGLAKQAVQAIKFPKNGNNWVILSDIEQRIKQKIEAVGTPLKEWNIKIYRGILTGCNEAFIINKEKRDELIKKCPKSAEIIRPILRGRDIKRYSYDFAELYLLNVHNGIREKNIPLVNIDDYPAIKTHLDQYWDKISVRDDRGKTPYNLRNCAYMDDFNKQKIIWTDIACKPSFVFSDKEIYFLNTAYMLSGHHLYYLLHILNSKLITFYFTHTATGLGNKGLRLFKIFVEKIPIPVYVNSDIQRSLDSYKPVINLQSEQEKINKWVNQLYHLNTEEIGYINSISE